MLTCVEALKFRSLRYLTTPLSRFQVLVGANGSGKSSFLDVAGFLGDQRFQGDRFLCGRRPQPAW